ncbi:OLC1v1026451C1 [Oldenlandia corymbosa var. corymbosa]|uniref:OLC1v1026451C1 n=1 Tax=Oldenlandia corymbosa var. corymbosa TaxID=529605 RepID=A0AAV1C746_OLDCO|nr:OLC1v1026451C1 [Oldenlandia corymbosa var. corymbosa]
MVVRMTKWRPWPPLSSKKFEVKITVKELQGLKVLAERVAGKSMVGPDCSRLAVEIKWKGSKGIALTSLRRSVKRNFTKEESLREDGVVEWNEEFQSVCSFGVVKDAVYHPWEVVFTVFNGSNAGENDKILLVAKSSLNLAGFGSTADKDVEVSIPMENSNSKVACNATLLLSLRLLEMKSAQDTSEVSHRPIPCLPLSPLREFSSPEKGDRSPAKTGSGKVNIFKGLSARRVKKDGREEDGSDGKSSTKSDDAEYVYPFDTDSVDDDTDKEDEATDGKASKSRKSVGYETLAQANHAGGLFYCSTSGSEDEDWIYYNHHKMDTGNSCYDNSDTSVPKTNQTTLNSPIDKILPWRKRKVSFKSSKAKGEPLLKRHYGDEGGDDIDFDRRQLCSSESSFGVLKSEEDAITSRSSVSEFGDDNFAVGSWEQREILSRDGHLKLKTSVFFASIDQRSERAAGEGACTSLVAVIADWFQNNRGEMPIKSQFDSLIREGSLDWRNLCENESYREQFPDKHFDLETVLQAKVHSLSVVPEKSFVGFFHPEGIEDGELDFLQGAMSFDNIWDEISQAIPSDCSAATDPLVYIVSWNDHFFILKVEQDAFYIVDTLGERLFEGCNQAFILKFDRDTTIQEVPSETQKSDDKAPKDGGEKVEGKDLKEVVVSEDQIVLVNKEEPTILFQGKDTCKEYIKSFLAAIPLRELQVDLKKGLLASVPLHHRLQIEFHYTKFSQPLVVSDPVEAVISNPMEAVVYTTESLPVAV